MHQGQAKDGHDGVADELLDRPAVVLDDPPHALEVAGQQGAQGFRVEVLSELRGARDVAEEHRHDLALLPSERLDERRGALVAELRTFRVLLAAARADGHAHHLATGAVARAGTPSIPSSR